MCPAVALAGLLACNTAAPPELAEAAPKTASPPVLATVEPPAPAIEPPAPAVPPPAPAPPDADGTIALPVLVPPAPVDAARLGRVAPAWEQVQAFAGEVELEPLAGGVLARIDGVPHELALDGALVKNPAADPKRPRALANSFGIDGVWPDDAWRITGTLRGRGDSMQISFYKWTDGRRWVAQPLAGRTVVSDHEMAAHRWTPRGGWLVVTADDGTASFSRVAGEHPAPAPLPFTGGRVLDAFEGADGTVFLFIFAVRGFVRSLEVLRSCAPASPPGCERSGGVAIEPPGFAFGTFNTGHIVARAGGALSAQIDTSQVLPKDETTRYLLHFDAGTWRLEAVPGNRSLGQMLPAADGGLWLTLGDHGQGKALWHRDTAGTWVAVDLPPRLADSGFTVQIALRDAAQLWLAGNTGDHHAIYRTAAAWTAPEVAPKPASPAP